LDPLSICCHYGPAQRLETFKSAMSALNQPYRGPSSILARFPLRNAPAPRATETTFTIPINALRCKSLECRPGSNTMPRHYSMPDIWRHEGVTKFRLALLRNKHCNNEHTSLIRWNRNPPPWHSASRRLCAGPHRADPWLEPPTPASQRSARGRARRRRSSRASTRCRAWLRQ
jgi:hypothetical protein